MAHQDEITLRGMRFQTLIGILPHERTIAQPLEVDLTVRLAEGEGVVDYGQLYDLTASVVAAGPTDYLEQIGDRVARAALAAAPRIETARVAVRKLHVALGGPLEYAEVVVERARDA